MTLNGTFDCLEVDDVLVLLAHRNATGQLHLRGPTRATLVLVDGKVAGARGTGASTFDHVVDWRELAEEACCRAVRSPRGGFEFVPDADARPMPGASITADQLVSAARRRADRWRAVETVIPSPDAVPRLTDRLTAERLIVDAEQWPVLVMIDGRHSLAALARRLDVGLLACCQLLQPLIEAGAVDFAPEPEKIAAKPEPHPPESAEGANAATQTAPRPVDHHHVRFVEVDDVAGAELRTPKARLPTARAEGRREAPSSAREPPA